MVDSASVKEAKLIWNMNRGRRSDNILDFGIGIL